MLEEMTERTASVFLVETHLSRCQEAIYKTVKQLVKTQRKVMSIGVRKKR